MASAEMRSQSSFEAKATLFNNRSFEKYASRFGYEGKEHELADNVILDIGSGSSSFSEGAQKHGAKVVSLDFGYAKHPPVDIKNSVAALAQELPFADESFDEVISLWCVSPWIKTGVDETLREMMRVAKKGGTVRINTIRIPDPDDALYSVENAEIASAFSFPQKGEVTIVLTKQPDFTDDQFEKMVEVAGRIISGKRKKAWKDKAKPKVIQKSPNLN